MKRNKKSSKNNFSLLGISSLFLTAMLLIAASVNGQKTVFFDDFNRTTLQSPGMDWKIQSTIDPVGRVILLGTSNNRLLQIFNTNEEAETGTPGATFVTGSLSSFDPAFKPVLKDNQGDVTWSFNMRSMKGLLTSFNKGPRNYAIAVVLAATDADLMKANGYAVTLIKGEKHGAVRLVSFTNGLGANANMKVIIGPGEDVGLNHTSIKVTYSPKNNKWQLAVRNDEKIMSKDPLVENKTDGFLAKAGNDIVDKTYTTQKMEVCGFFFNHGIASRNLQAKANFDNFKVTVAEK